MSEPVKSRRLNASGVKNMSDMWRTFNGAHYHAWDCYVSAERIAAYRAAGVRCRRVKDDLFVHHEDGNLAWSVDDRPKTPSPHPAGQGDGT